MVGKTCKFAYPEKFATLPLYQKHRGETVTIIRRAIATDEVDISGEEMYVIRAADGWVGYAFESEITPI